MLLIIDYEKRYDDTVILRIDNLELANGIYWIKGENGSGKSTFFKSVAGLVPFTGKIVFDAVDCKANPVDYRSRINFAEAEPLYPGFLTAKDLIRFIGKTKGASSENMTRITKHFGVDGFYEKACETFSSGMLKKLSLTLAFLGNPKLIILDEPLITLDDQTRAKLVELINHCANHGVMFLISSHQLIENNLTVSGIYEIKQKSIHLA
ncbi:MAG TPA: ATP-binding cassette domain-containing protein [Chryseosolibacter sp.]